MFTMLSNGKVATGFAAYLDCRVILPMIETERLEGVPGRYWHRLGDGRIQCDVCPRLCKLHQGQRGLCFVRGRQDDQIVLTTYGRSSGFCLDPIEKKPLNHYLPGTPVLSFGTAGCNLTCKFCQNWDISKARALDRLQDRASPETIVAAAVASGARSIAYTYNDPVIFLEYEITTLLIPGHNDSAQEVRRLSEWVLTRLGSDVPLHFTAFHPDYKMLDVPPTPARTLRMARDTARQVGLRYVYIGNVHDEAGQSTYCPGCGNCVIGRDWYEITAWRLDPKGCCSRCGTPRPGVFEAHPGRTGQRRVPGPSRPAARQGRDPDAAT